MDWSWHGHHAHVKPGEPVCHLGIPTTPLAKISQEPQKSPSSSCTRRSDGSGFGYFLYACLKRPERASQRGFRTFPLRCNLPLTKAVYKNGRKLTETEKCTHRRQYWDGSGDDTNRR